MNDGQVPREKLAELAGRLEPGFRKQLRMCLEDLR